MRLRQPLMRTARWILSSALLCIWLATSSWAGATVYVDDDTCPATGSGTVADPYCRIQTGICSIRNTGGGTVLVSPGLYNESLRMFPGVSVVSTDGPEVTTLDGTGRPCTLSSCGTSTSNLTCSTVVFGSGSTNSDRLEGFRITGGSGLFREFGDGTTAVAGGGVFVFGSSPTITNNEISSNILFSNGTAYFWGAGIYLGGGTYNNPTYPIVTNNLIEENVAIPPDTGVEEEGIGGGVFANVYTAPMITDNVIRSNRAGDNTTFNGAGGGVAMYSISPFRIPEISRNLIQDNAADANGGGLFFGAIYYQISEYVEERIPTRGSVQSNLIELNRAFAGGGGLTLTTLALFENNTIVDNTANFGGGLATYNSPGSEPDVVNNIVAFNSALLYGAGGVGFFTYPDRISHNNFFSNVPNNIDGGITEPEVIGFHGNVSVDPRFKSRIAGSRDLQLMPSSPMIETGDPVILGTLDALGAPRVQDAEYDGDAVVDIGAYEFSPDFDNDGIPDWTDEDDDDDDWRDALDNCPLATNVEQTDSDGDGLGDPCDVCPFDATNDGDADGLCASQDNCPLISNPFQEDADGDDVGDPCDNCVADANADQADGDADGDGDVCDNCPAIFNSAQADLDGDGLGNVCDDDDDNDTVTDAEDCAPFTPGVARRPGVVGDDLRLSRAGSATQLRWGRGRQGHTSNVYRGSIASGTPWEYDETCLYAEISTTSALDFSDPAPGEGFYYLISADNICGESAATIASDGTEHFPTAACPAQGRDNDGDGWLDFEDNCPNLANASQTDLDGDFAGLACDNCQSLRNFDQLNRDGDGFGDACDNCPLSINNDQIDTDGDGLGDACDECSEQDQDGDDQCDIVDNCPMTPNASQSDFDEDGIGDACDSCTDTDGDGFGNAGFQLNTCPDDNCPTVANPDQTETDGDGLGDACDACPLDFDNDSDGDSICGDVDNCPDTPNPDQLDEDLDGIGDACDNCPQQPNVDQADSDLDATGNACDNCPTTANADQSDRDVDGLGDLCDACADDANNDVDGDGACGDVDNCPNDPNASQLNSDTDPFGDACDNCPNIANNQIDNDADGLGDLCDTCTDGDGDGFGDPDLPFNQCAVDNCPGLPNDQANADGDANGDACDNCPLDAFDDQDLDGLCADVDNCPLVSNFDQTNTDGDALGDACDTDDDGDTLLDAVDNCPLIPNLDQTDGDGDGFGDICDNCRAEPNPDQEDRDLDNIGDPCDTCPDDALDDEDEDGLCADLDNCPMISNNDQTDQDSDGVGDICDSCPTDPDFDGDLICNDERALIEGSMVDEQVLIEFGTRQDVVLVEESSLMRFQVNLIDPLMGLTWTAPEFDDSTWTFGSYGIGYEAVTGAENLLRTTVADGAFSVYTRARFEIADTSLVDNLWFGADYDDAVVVWINGVEVLRTSQMPPGDPAWNADPSNHESSNGPAPYYEPQMNISALGIPALVDGENVIAIGVYNNVALDGTASSDLVLVPRLSMNRTPTMRYLANTTDPGLGLSWTTEAFNDSSWESGNYGVGFEADTGAEELIQSEVSAGTSSIYTRAKFNIDNIAELRDLHLGVDYDDGFVAYVNGVEVLRSPSMPAGDPAWNASPAARESSNRVPARYDPITDITEAALSVLHAGENTLAVGVWNRTSTSSDLVLAVRLSINRNAPLTMNYLANGADPGIGESWVEPGFDDSAWTPGAFGVGYETTAAGARQLIRTEVPPGTFSVYTRSTFLVPNPTAISRLLIGADYDDGYVAWINGFEVFRSPEMPSGTTLWNSNPNLHESTNGDTPRYEPRQDITSNGLSRINAGENVLAVGIWNNEALESNDLVLVPRLSFSGGKLDNCPDVFNPDQLDTDGDGVGDNCDVDDDNDGTFDVIDNCRVDANPSQADSETAAGPDATCGTLDDNPALFGADLTCGTADDLIGDGVGDACDNCLSLPNAEQLDERAGGPDGLCGNEDDLPALFGADGLCGTEDDLAGDGVGESCDNCPGVLNSDQLDAEGDGLGDVCDLDDDNDGIADDGDQSGTIGDDTCGHLETANCDDNCPLDVNPGQEDRDFDTFGDACDCNPDHDGVWQLAGEATIELLHSTLSGETQIDWIAPTDLGGTAPVTYDVLRSSNAGDFVAGDATCVESDGADTVGTDSATPASGVTFYYLVRAENACPGPHSLGLDSAGTERPGRSCP